MSDEDKFDANKFKDDLRNRIHSAIHESVNMGDDKQSRQRSPLVIGIHLGKNCKNCEGSWGIFTGVLILLVGLIILLDNMNVVAAGQLFRFWPLLLIAFGLMHVFGRRGSRAFGTMLVFFGALLQLDKLGILHLTWGVIWGLAWMAVGIAVMWGSLAARKLMPAKSGSLDDPTTSLAENVVFGGIERRLTTKDFRGGTATAIFGGIELDLSEADMQQEEARLEVNAIFGGVELRVPYNWQVVSRGTPVFGGFVDKTRLRDTGNDVDSKRKVLVLTGSAIFGGVDVKN